MITDSKIGTTINRLINPAMLIKSRGVCIVVDTCWIKSGRMVIHDASDLRQSLSDELHARAFYDFAGADRFIRFVYLVGNDDSAILNYVNDYLQTRALALMQAAEKFYRIELDGFAVRVERHTDYNN